MHPPTAPPRPSTPTKAAPPLPSLCDPRTLIQNCNASLTPSPTVLPIRRITTTVQMSKAGSMLTASRPRSTSESTQKTRMNARTRLMKMMASASSPSASANPLNHKNGVNQDECANKPGARAAMDNARPSHVAHRHHGHMQGVWRWLVPCDASHTSQESSEPSQVATHMRLLR